MSRDLNYIQTRAQQERAAAAAATSENARRIHEELASRYEAFLRPYANEATKAA
jgi:hypothetical protein